MKGYTLIELLVVGLIIGVLAAIAIPQYFNAVENARLTELRILWGRTKDALTGRELSARELEKIREHLQKANLKNFDAEIICREDAPQDTPCFEAVFTRRSGSVQYQITTVNNFRQLACVPGNALGKKFCKSRAGASQEITVDEKESYLIR